MRFIIVSAVALVLWAACDAGTNDVNSTDTLSAVDVLYQQETTTTTSPKADEPGDATTTDMGPQDTTPPVDYTGKWCPRLNCRLEPRPDGSGNWNCPPIAGNLGPNDIPWACGDVK